MSFQGTNYCARDEFTSSDLSIYRSLLTLGEGTLEST